MEFLQIIIEEEDTIQEEFTCHLSSFIPYKCNLCEFETDFKVLLHIHKKFDDHLNKYNQNSTTFFYKHCCRNCEFKSNSLLVYLKHSLNCNTDFLQTTKNDLFKKRIEEKHACIDDAKTLNCEFCDYIAPTKNELTTHLVYIHPRRISKLKCRLCGFATKCRNSLNNHMAIHIKAREKYVCEHCGFKPATITNLKEHLIFKHTKPEDVEWFKCDLCTYKGRAKRLLHRHLQRIHHKNECQEENEPVMCEICGFLTNRKRTLYSHKTKKHPKTVQSFQCEFCSYKTNRKSHLNVHLICKHRHSDEIVWWLCEFCPYRSKLKGNLTMHIKTKHLKE